MRRKENGAHASAIESIQGAPVPGLRGAAHRGILSAVRLRGVVPHCPVPREREIVARIVKALRAIPGCVVRKRHGAGWGFAGEPDLYGSVRGRHFEIEVKRPGSRLTLLQELRLAEWRASGAITGVAHSVDEALAIVMPASGRKTAGGKKQ